MAISDPADASRKPGDAHHSCRSASHLLGSTPDSEPGEQLGSTRKHRLRQVLPSSPHSRWGTGSCPIASGAPGSPAGSRGQVGRVSPRTVESALSLRDLEAYGRLWGAGSERRALCPFCGDNHSATRRTLAWL